ncbi:MAG TPA: hypothetical protein DG761_07650 [Gammaproteobacteria bacterium]|nr:hypothetical protein [Gammaproteobacteria bacterium]
MNSDENVIVDLSQRQSDAWYAMERDGIRAVLYGGAKGGGKSVLLCLWAYHHARDLANRYGIGPNRYPPTVGFLGRRRSVDFSNTTLETWKSFIPADGYELRLQAKEIVIEGRVKLKFGGMDDSESVRKFNSAEYGFFCIDQAEELEADMVGMLRGTLRLRLANQDVPIKELYTCNPAQCYLKREFIDMQKPGQRFIRALPADNEFLHADYISNLERAFSHRPELLAAYLHGSWSIMAGFDVVIHDRWVAEALAREIHEQRGAKFLSCDVARYGDDETVVYLMQDCDILKEWIYGQRDTYWTANLLHAKAIEHNVSAVCIDEVGLGAGSVDALRPLAGGQYLVIGINGAARSSQPERYANLRAEMWDTTARKFEEGAIELNHDEEELRRQLSVPRFEFRHGKVLVQAKDKIKKALGRSPDRADCYVQGCYVADQVPARKTKDRRSALLDAYRKKQRRVTAMAS